MATSEVMMGPEKLCKPVKSVTTAVCGAVGCTIGPFGNTVALGNSFGQTRVTKDGYQVMNSIKYDSSCPAEKAIFDLLSKAISEANNEAGDGSSTTAVLCGELANSVMTVKANYNTDMLEVKKGIQLASVKVLEKLKSLSTKITSEDEIAQIATISANGDVEIGRAIAREVYERGNHGVITVEESKASHPLLVERTEGMQFDRGYLSPYFVTNFEKLIAEYDNPYVLVTSKKITTVQAIVPILEALYTKGSGSSHAPLVIIAEDVEGDALNTLVINKVRSGLPVIAIKAPGFGDRRKDMLEDIVVATGAKSVISDELGLKIEDVKPEDLGRAKRILVTKDNTTIIEGNSEEDQVKKRVASLELQIKNSTSDYDKEKLQERLARLSKGVSILKVGGPNEISAKELKDRVEDALNAAKAAVAEGIVPGGGAALLYASRELKSLKAESNGQQLGIDIVKRSIVSPIRKIVDNSSITESPCVVKHLSEQNDEKLIFNVATGNYANALTSGVIDPLKVVRIAFTQAISFASMLMTLDAIIVDVPSKDDSSATPAGGGMGGMGGGF